MKKSSTDYAHLKIKAVALVKNGQSASEVGRELGVFRGSIRRWVKIFDEHGVKKLISSRRGANFCISKLNKKQIALLVNAVSASAKGEGFPDEYWSPSRVRRYIKREFDVNYSIQQIKPLLEKHGIVIKSERDRNVLPKTLFVIKRKKPTDFGLQYDDWTLEIVIRYMRATSGKQYSPEYVRRFLKSHGIEFKKER